MIELQIINTALLKEQALFDLMKYSKKIFSSPRCQIIFDIMEQLYSQNRKVDLSSLISEAQKQDLYVKIGGNNLITDLSKHSSSIDHILLLKNLETERRKKAIKVHSTEFLNNKITIDEFIDTVQPLFETKIDADDGTDIGDYLRQGLDKIFHSGLSVSTGLTKLDVEIGGLFKGDLTLIAARPGLDKTTLALQIAKTTPEPVLFFSFEMKMPQITAKLINSVTGIPMIPILQNTLNDDQRRRVLAASPKIEKYTISFFDKSDSFQTVLSQIRKGIRKQKAGLVVIDYIQQIDGGKGNNPNERIGYISRQLKKLAMSEDIPILALSQFSREVEKQEREPRLSDLRDSGSLEQDATTVLFIHEDSIIVGKSRLGRVGKISGFIHEKAHGRFVEVRDNAEFDQYRSFK